MDQLALVISWIKKKKFWLGCGVLAVSMIAVWFLTTLTLAKETEDNETTLTTNINTARGILGVSAEEGVDAHPNASSEVGMKEELRKTADSIVAAWRIREDAQKELLVWPPELKSDPLIAFFEKYNPPERYPEILQNEGQIQPGLLLYGRRIPERMNYLCGDEVLRAHWKFSQLKEKSGKDDNEKKDTKEGLGGNGLDSDPAKTTTDSDEKKYAVVWSEINQSLWFDKMTKFRGLDDNTSNSSSPTALQCYMLQQDLWLLEAMFKIIRQVNGNATANDLAAIKRIDHIAIGREAIQKLGELELPDADAGVEKQLTKREQRLSVGQGTAEEETRIAVAETNLPFDLRYVDVNYDPLPAMDVQNIIMGKTLPENNLELIVAKRVPVRIALRMDENKIAEFMAACANSPFAFEIQQVRLNRHQSGGEDIRMAGINNGSASAGDKTSNMGGMAGMDMGSSFDSGGPGLTSKGIEIRTNYDVNVEFFGIVKIYNPVREKFLYDAIGIEQDNVSPRDGASVTPIKPGNLTP